MSHPEAGYDLDRRLLTRAEVADQLRVAPRTVARLLASGELPYVRIGRAVRVRTYDLDHFVARHRTESHDDG
jgi:excisionase family DNA binding protein